MNTKRKRLGKKLTIAVSAGSLLALGVGAVPAYATSTPTPTHVRESASTSTSFTVTTDHKSLATSYRIYASPVKSDIYAVNFGKASKVRKVVSSKSPKLTVGGYKYTAAPIWYRVAIIRGPYRKLGAMIEGYLTPARPTSLALTHVGSAVSLSWNGNAASYQILRSADAAGHSSPKYFTVSSINGKHFTPYGDHAGATYYYRVRGLNGTRVSAYAGPVAGAATGVQQVVRVASYNVIEANFAGTKEGDGKIASWTARLPGVVALIKKTNPDILGVQEAAAWVSSVQGYGGKRQIDSLVAQLPGYALARTEIPPTEHGYFRASVYIVYRKSAFTAVGVGGHWSVGDDRNAAYQILRSTKTGALVLAVTSHDLAGHSAKLDAQRGRETATMFADARSYAASHNVASVVYPADYNSFLGHGVYPTDGPGNAARAVGVNDARASAQSFSNAQYDSANQYVHAPAKNGFAIDHVYTSPAVAVVRFGVTVTLVRGRYPSVIPSDHNPVWADVVLRS